MGERRLMGDKGRGSDKDGETECSIFVGSVSSHFSVDQCRLGTSLLHLGHKKRLTA